MDIWKINDGLFYQVRQKAQPKKEEELLWARISNGKAVKGDSFSQKIGNTPAKNGAITNGKTKTGEESAVSAYLRKNPLAYKEVADAMQTGRAYLSKKWFGGNPTTDMDLDEYKAYMSDLMKKSNVGIRKDSTAMVDNINDKAWEQMKNDPDFEAWMVGNAALGKDVTREDSSSDVEEALQDFYRGQMFGMSGLTGDSGFSMNSGDIGMMRYAMQQGNGKLMSALLGEQNMGSLLNFFR